MFVDIEAYSKRRTQNQIAVVEAFTEALSQAITAISQRYIDYAQNNDINLKTDIIRLPTGDGAAVVFTFEGLSDIHLNFALELLRIISNPRDTEICDRFVSSGWCNCHPYLNLRVGISDGKGILFRDVNGNFNLAGDVINMAARVMGLVGRNQIAFTEHAYDQIVDLAQDPNLADRFRKFDNVKIKHGIRVAVYQYIDEASTGLSSIVPEDLAADLELDAMVGRLSAVMPNFGDLDDDGFTKTERIAALKGMEELMQSILGMTASMGVNVVPGHAVPTSQLENGAS